MSKCIVDLTVDLVELAWFIKELSFPLIEPSFVKVTQLAQLDKTSYAW